MKNSTKLGIKLDHLYRMTDSVGILEHCIFTTPDRKEGYSTDDNARALQVFLRLKDERAKVYLQFLLSARDKEGFYQDLNADLTWKEDVGVTEGFGRAMAALGEASITALTDDQKLTAVFVFDTQLPLMKKVSEPRALAQVITGLSYRIKFEVTYPKLVSELLMRKKLKADVSLELPFDLKQEVINLAEKLRKFYQTASTNSWKWFENVLTYDNGRLPLGMLYAYEVSQDKKYLDTALESLDFLIEKTYDLSKDYFSFPGYRGWYPKNGEKAKFGQQPIEAGSMVEVLTKAFQLTKSRKYLDLANQALNWYKGKNILGVSLLDEKSGGVKDGLEEWGVNPNQGAESILSYAIACLALKAVKS